jgi:hypothetical protein
MATKFTSLNFLPGFHRESTQYAEEGKWYDGNRVRFREGKPENLRGYEKHNTESLVGIARDILAWADNDTRKHIILGTNEQVYVEKDQTLYDVTPIVSVVSASDIFSTNAGSALVSVNITNHGAQAGDRIIIEAAATVGGNIDLTTSAAGGPIFTIVTAATLNDFTIQSVITATDTSATAGGTAVSVAFLLPKQLSNSIQGLGWGAGNYNAGASVTGGRAWNNPSATSGFTFRGAQWQFDNWGEDILGLRRGGNLFYFDTDVSITPERMKILTSATNAPVVTVTDAPSQSNYFVVSPNDRHVICYATNEYASGNFNAMLVRWSDQENFTNWTPSIQTTSGEVILADGTEIVGAVRSRNSIHIWSDNAMYTQQFVGPPFIFNFQQVGTNCGLIAPHAAIDYDGISFWMGDNNFYAFDGRVNNLPCTIRRHIFDDFNMTNKDKVFAGVNSEFKEIIWLYPRGNSTEPNAYVIFNVAEQTWVYGDTFYTTFADRNIYDNTLTTGAVSATAGQYLWDNEPADLYTGDGLPLSSYIESAKIDIEDGTQIMFMDKIIPDYTLGTGNDIEIYVKTNEYPASPDIIKGPFTINSTTKKIDFRARGRQASVRVSGTNDGTWRWGSVRVGIQPDGGR